MCSITPCQTWRGLYLKAKFGLECIKGGSNLSFNQPICACPCRHIWFRDFVNFIGTSNLTFKLRCEGYFGRDGVAIFFIFFYIMWKTINKSNLKNYKMEERRDWENGGQGFTWFGTLAYIHMMKPNMPHLYWFIVNNIFG